MPGAHFKGGINYRLNLPFSSIASVGEKYHLLVLILFFVTVGKGACEGSRMQPAWNGLLSQISVSVTDTSARRQVSASKKTNINKFPPKIDLNTLN